MTVFYIWQSDIEPASANNLINRALVAACKAVASDLDLELAPDRATDGRPGSPDIAATIFEKIPTAVAVVADVSIVTPALAPDGSRGEGKLSPNPNVLIELGYAKAALGEHAVLMVMNTDYGAIEDLPFDLRPRKVIPFSPNNAGSKSKAEAHLQARLEAELRQIVADAQNAETVIGMQALVDAVEHQASNRVALARRYVTALAGEIDANAPHFASKDVWAKRAVSGQGDGLFYADEVHRSLLAFAPAIASVAHVARAVALADDSAVGGELVQLLRHLFERYQLPAGWSGTLGGKVQAELDVYRGLGHACCLALVAAYLADQRWDLLRNLVTSPFRLRNVGNAPVGIGYGAQGMETITPLAHGRYAMATARMQLAEALHAGTPLGAVVSLAEAVQADLFLTIQTAAIPDARWELRWHPYLLSLVSQDSIVFLDDAEDGRVAEGLALGLALDSVVALQDNIRMALDRMGRTDLEDRRFRMVLSQIDPARIATR